MKTVLLLLGLCFFVEMHAQKAVLVAEKRGRQLSFVEGKRYTFSYFDGESIRTQKGELTIIQDSILQIKGKKQTVAFPLSRLHGVYHYRHWSSVVLSVLQTGLGATIAVVSFGEAPLSFEYILYGTIGVVYVADGILSLAGVQTVGVLGPTPSTTRRFTFRIQR
jgi:hypothetical protein